MATIAAIINIGDQAYTKAKSVKRSRRLRPVLQQHNGRQIFDSIIEASLILGGLIVRVPQESERLCDRIIGDYYGKTYLNSHLQSIEPSRIFTSENKENGSTNHNSRPRRS